MTNVAGKSIDTTYLSLTTAADRGFIHRDYVAHCLRWSHVIKHLRRGSRYKEAIIWDIGCGRELPLALSLYTDRCSPLRYVGVDYGIIEEDRIAKLSKTGKFNGTYYPNTDAAEFPWEGPAPTDVVCLEMAEHIEPAHVVRLLKHIHATMAHGGNLWLSTPCWNYTDCADHHVNEMTYKALGCCLEACGFRVENHYGTFASQSDYKYEFTAEQQEVFRSLQNYFDSNMLSCIMGPLMHPRYARNCLWQLRHATEADERQFEDYGQKPWTSSKQWEQLCS